MNAPGLINATNPHSTGPSLAARCGNALAAAALSLCLCAGSAKADDQRQFAGVQESYSVDLPLTPSAEAQNKKAEAKEFRKAQMACWSPYRVCLGGPSELYQKGSCRKESSQRPPGCS
jgi:hypothetical protein